MSSLETDDVTEAPTWAKTPGMRPRHLLYLATLCGLVLSLVFALPGSAAPPRPHLSVTGIVSMNVSYFPRTAQERGPFKRIQAFIARLSVIRRFVRLVKTSHPPPYNDCALRCVGNIDLPADSVRLDLSGGGRRTVTIDDCEGISVPNGTLWDNDHRIERYLGTVVRG